MSCTAVFETRQLCFCVRKSGIFLKQTGRVLPCVGEERPRGGVPLTIQDLVHHASPSRLGPSRQAVESVKHVFCALFITLIGGFTPT